MALVGSEFESNGSGEINSVDMLKSGTSYVSHNLEGDTQPFSGSYAPVEKGVHQCGGAKKNKRTKKNKKNNKRNNKRNNKSNKKRNNKKNKSQRKRR
jgi:hypothetical protein